MNGSLLSLFIELRTEPYPRSALIAPEIMVYGEHKDGMMQTIENLFSSCRPDKAEIILGEQGALVRPGRRQPGSSQHGERSDGTLRTDRC